MVNKAKNTLTMKGWMKKGVLVLLMVGMGYVVGVGKSPADTTFPQKNIISVGSGSVIYLLLPLIPSNAAEVPGVLLNYRRQFGKFYGRISNVFFYNQFHRSRVLYNYASVGVERFFPFHSALLFPYYGVDLLHVVQHDYNVSQVAHREGHQYLGLAPLVGLRYVLSPRFSLSMELGAGYGLTYDHWNVNDTKEQAGTDRLYFHRGFSISVNYHF